MEQKPKTAIIEALENELALGITVLKGLVNRGASDTMITFQTKIIRGTIDDLVIEIWGKKIENGIPAKNGN